MINYFIIYETNELIWISPANNACQSTHLSWMGYDRVARIWRHTALGKWWFSYPRGLESIYTFILIDWKKYCVL